jgi:nuclear transport factor 2 (NTF2) superfamily protein
VEHQGPWYAIHCPAPYALELTAAEESVVKAYTENTLWRNREHFFRGRAAAQEFLTKKWQREHFYM